MINTAPYVMLLMRANPLRGQVGGGWALEIETFFGPMKWHRAIRRVPFRAKKSRDFHSSKIHQKTQNFRKSTIQPIALFSDASVPNTTVM